MQRRVQPLARAVAGEHAAGAVGAVRRRREADDDDPRRRIAEARHRPRPVALAAIAARRVGGHLLAPGDQPRAAPAGGRPARRARRARVCGFAAIGPGRVPRMHTLSRRGLFVLGGTGAAGAVLARLRRGEPSRAPRADDAELLGAALAAETALGAAYAVAGARSAASATPLEQFATPPSSASAELDAPARARPAASPADARDRRSSDPVELANAAIAAYRDAAGLLSTAELRRDDDRVPRRRSPPSSRRRPSSPAPTRPRTRSSPAAPRSRTIAVEADDDAGETTTTRPRRRQRAPRSQPPRGAAPRCARRRRRSPRPASLRPALAAAQRADDEDLRDFLVEAIGLEQVTVLAYATAADASGGADAARDAGGLPRPGAGARERAAQRDRLARLRSPARPPTRPPTRRLRRRRGARRGGRRASRRAARRARRARAGGPVRRLPARARASSSPTTRPRARSSTAST